MSRKSLLFGVALFLFIGGVAALLLSSNTIGRENSKINFSIPVTAAGSPLIINDGEERTIPNNTPTTIIVMSNGSLVSIANTLSFLVSPLTGDATIKVSFSNGSFSAQPNTPQPVRQMNVLYLKVETNISAAIAGSVVTLFYNQSEVLFTERALWIFSYNAGTWTRVATNVDPDSAKVTFQIPNETKNEFELCLAGQETRGMEFPIWAWVFILVSFGIITFMAVGELVYQGYIPVAMKGTDGRVQVAFKRFFGAWGRKFTQLNDKVGGFIDYYENMSRTVPPIPPEKRPKAVSSLGHINRLGLQEEAEKLEEVYRPIITSPQPIVIANTSDKNPIAKAVFQETTPVKQEEEPGEKTFTPYIPAAVRPKHDEKSVQKSPTVPKKQEKRAKSQSEVAKLPSTAAKPLLSETKAEETGIPADLMKEAAVGIKAIPAPEEVKKPAKKAAKKKAAKKATKKPAAG